jgi:hypothetical protein
MLLKSHGINGVSMAKMSQHLLMVFLFLLLAVSSFADMATLTVQGEAEIMVPADRAVFSLAVVTEAGSSEQAMQLNTDRIEKVLAALRRAGLEEKEINTGQFTVSPRWSNRPHQVPEGWRPEIVGFSVTNRLQVKTIKLDSVGKLLGVAIRAGSNEVQGLHFDLADTRQYRQEAIRLATNRAHQDARVLADAAGSKLGRIMSLNLDHARPVPIVAQRAFMAEAAMASPAPAIIPGDVTVRASVTAVYELKSDK